MLKDINSNTSSNDNNSSSNLIINNTNIYNISDASMLFKILVEIMQKLRSDDGCMWDKEQTHQSIKRNLLEEAYEAVESIEENNYENLKEEMGDILLQVVFHSQIAKENNKFNISDVIKTIIFKLIRRHPHVFGKTFVTSSKEVLANWEEIKKEERKQKQAKNHSIFSNIPNILPALHLAYEIQNRAARLDFDWENTDGVIDKINEEVLELNKAYNDSKDSLKIQDEIGDLLFSIVNLCRHLNIDAEQCLKKTCNKFIKRFDYMQEYSEKNNINFKNLSLKEKDKIWKLAKKRNHPHLQDKS